MLKNQETVYNPRDIKNWLKGLAHLAMFRPLVQSCLGLLDRLLGPALRNFGRFLKPIGRVINIVPENSVVRLKEHLLVTKDGGKLATDVFLPKAIYESRGKGPTILIRLPYWKNILALVGYIFASKGYVTVIQDIRGSARSLNYGTNSLFVTERQDGLETLQWISKRFWYNEKIGMWGLSYLGLTQLAVSWDNDGLLTCINPTQCCYTNMFWHPKGLYPIGESGSIYLLMRMVSQYEEVPPFNYHNADPEGYADDLYTNPMNALYNEKIETKKKNLSDLAKIGKVKYQVKTMNSLYGLNLDVSKRSEDGSFEKLVKEIFYKRNLKHDYDIAPYAFGFEYKPDTPMLTIHGWYDMFVEQFMRDVKILQEKAPDYFKNDFKLIVGPWAHFNLDKLYNIKTDFYFFQKLFPFWWFEYWLKKDENRRLKGSPIQIYVLNRKIWRNFDYWPPESEEMKLYLHSKGKANSRFGDGMLSEKIPDSEAPDNYDFDPSNPLAMIGGRNLFLKSGPRDHSKNEERNDVLIYTSDKLKQGIEVIGEIKIKFHASSSAKDTDFMVKLLNVSPNGKKAINIVDSGVRARYREGDLHNPSLIDPGKVYEYEILIGSTAIYFPKNHRIRLEISSSYFPRFDINSNLGGDDTGERYIIANQTIFHDKEHPSCLILPKYKGK